MGTFHPYQSNFTAGEISKIAQGRVDLVQYNNAVEELTNYIPMIQGGIEKRPGTKHVKDTRHSATKSTRLIPFKFSTTQEYVLEFGENYIRVFKDEAIVTESDKTITDATNATPIVITSTAHGYSNGDYVIVTGVLGNTAANGTWVVANQTANTFELTSSVGSGAYTSGGTANKIVEITTTYTEAQLDDIKFDQSADTLYIVHPDHDIAKLTRTSHTAWTLADVDYQNGPFKAINTTATTVTSSAAGVGATTLTASAALFASTDVGRWFLSQDAITSPSNYAIYQIDSFTSSTSVDATIKERIGNSHQSAHTTWAFGSWSDTEGWPSTVTFHNQRLYFGNTAAEPQTVWGSVTRSFEDFRPFQTDLSVVDTDAVTFEVASRGVNAMNWMVDSNNLLLGTFAGVREMKSATAAGPITPNSIDVKKRTSYGAKDVTPVEVGASTLYSDRSGKKLRALTFDFVIDTYRARDISALAEHLLEEGTSIKEIAYMQNPHSIVWVLCTSGQLFGLTHDPDHDVAAWFRYVPGGTLTGATQPFVESISVISKSDASEDQLWLIVKRTINSATARHIEFMEDFYRNTDDTDKDDMYFVDDGATYDGAATTTITGLEHLEGEAVQVVGDGQQQANATVSSGSITITSASKVHVGYHSNSQFKTLPLEGGNPKGISQGKIKNVDHVNIRLHKSIMLKYGPDYDNLYDLFEIHAHAETGDLITDDLRAPLGAGHNKKGQYVVRQDKPYASTILCLMPEVTVTGR